MRFYLVICVVLCTISCASKKPRSPASNNRAVLYIGDSQSAGPLGKVVYEHLQKKIDASDINLYGVGSSSPRHWGSNRTSPQFGEYNEWLCDPKRKARVGLAQRVSTQASICKRNSRESVFSNLNVERPGFVIFQFLGNSMRMSDEMIVNRIQNLLAKLDDSQKCLWITSPPYYRGLGDKFETRNKRRAETEAIFVQAIGDRCDVFRGMQDDNWERFAQTYEYYYSKDETGRIRGDGMHFNTQGARAFYETFKHKLP